MQRHTVIQKTGDRQCATCFECTADVTCQSQWTLTATHASAYNNNNYYYYSPTIHRITHSSAHQMHNINHITTATSRHFQSIPTLFFTVFFSIAIQPKCARLNQSISFSNDWLTYLVCECNLESGSEASRSQLQQVHHQHSSRRTAETKHNSISTFATQLPLKHADQSDTLSQTAAKNAVSSQTPTANTNICPPTHTHEPPCFNIICSNITTNIGLYIYIPNIRFVFASMPNSGPNSVFVFGRIVSSERIRIVSPYMYNAASDVYGRLLSVISSCSRLDRLILGDE